MLRTNRMSGFTLIELMVVIVIIGVLASLAIPRFTKASVKAKVAEAPRVIASFESAFLAAEAELGGTNIKANDIIFKTGDVNSKWFTYSLSEETNSLNGIDAAAADKLGAIAQGEALESRYIASASKFTHSFSACGAAPTPTANPSEMDAAQLETATAADKAAADKYADDCSRAKRYVPNFL